MRTLPDLAVLAVRCTGLLIWEIPTMAVGGEDIEGMRGTHAATPAETLASDGAAAPPDRESTDSDVARDDRQGGAEADGRDARAERLARALRANLRRRKAQGRARARPTEAQCFENTDESDD